MLLCISEAGRTKHNCRYFWCLIVSNWRSIYDWPREKLSATRNNYEKEKNRKNMAADRLHKSSLFIPLMVRVVVIVCKRNKTLRKLNDVRPLCIHTPHNCPTLQPDWPVQKLVAHNRFVRHVLGFDSFCGAGRWWHLVSLKMTELMDSHCLVSKRRKSRGS